MTWGKLASSPSAFGLAIAVLVGILSRHLGLVVIAMRNPSLAIGAPGRPTLRCRGRIGPFPRLREDRRVIVNLSFCGLGLLLMLVLSLIGLNATAGRTLSPEQSVTLARPSTIPMERIYHIQLLP